jgi:hypothetical protein
MPDPIQPSPQEPATIPNTAAASPTTPEQAPAADPAPQQAPAPVASETEVPAVATASVAPAAKPAAAKESQSTQDKPPFFRTNIGFVLISVFIPLAGVVAGLAIALTGRVYFHKSGEYVPMSKLQSIFIPVFALILEISLLSRVL